MALAGEVGHGRPWSRSPGRVRLSLLSATWERRERGPSWAVDRLSTLDRLAQLVGSVANALLRWRGYRPVMDMAHREGESK